MIADPAFLIVDLQNDFCNPRFRSEDEAEFQSIEAAIESTERFLDRYRETGREPIYIRTHHDERSNSPLWTEKYASEGRSIPCRPGTDGAEFVSALDVQSSDLVLTKHRYSAFHQTSLDLYLTSNAISRLLVAGVNSEVCVASTAIDAYNRDYDVTVLSDCTATFDTNRHEAILGIIDDWFGSVSESDDIDLSPVTDT